MTYANDDNYQTSIDKARSEARRLENLARETEKRRAEQVARDKELEKELGDAYGMLRDPMYLFLQSIEDDAVDASGVMFKLQMLDDDSPVKQTLTNEAKQRAEDAYKKLPGTPAFPDRTMTKLYQNALNEVAAETADGTLLLGRVEGQRLKDIGSRASQPQKSELMLEMEALKREIAQAIADGLE
jgi:hypothetical protein